MRCVDWLRSLGGAAACLLYPHRCLVCRRGLPDGGILCGDCDARLARLRPPFCAVCSQPFDGAITQTFTCATCGTRRYRFVHAISTRMNTGLARQVVHRFKYQRQFALRRVIAPWLVECLADPRMLPFDVIVPVPLHPTRLREREFNQALALAEPLARAAGRPLLSDALRRVRRTVSQTRFHRERRLENLRGAFRHHPGRAVAGRRVLLVDDVFTTGATVDECARVLLRAGAATVQVATAARS